MNYSPEVLAETIKMYQVFAKVAYTKLQFDKKGFGTIDIRFEM